MNCLSSRELMGAYLDEELEAGLEAEIQGHLAECRDCAAVYARLLDQKADIRSRAPRYEAPAVLVASVRSVLRREAAMESGAPKANLSWRWAALAASVLVLISLAWNFTLVRSRPAGRDVLTENLFSSHISSLMGTHLLDVPSSDQHTVKPWFNGKLDFSPDVKDLTAQGFPLIGGRMEYLSGRAVAALVYRRRQHVINLFTWPELTPGGDTSQRSRQGYNLVHWEKAGMTYWAVSDITVAELEQFRNLYEM
jgi:anti-sigma factor RsiW